MWDLPLWAWRHYVAWYSTHVEDYKKAAKEGVHCVNC